MIAENSIQFKQKVRRRSVCTEHYVKIAKTEPVAEDRNLKFPDIKIFSVSKF